MIKHKSTLDTLRTSVVNGLEDDRLLHLLRIKIIRKLESIIVGKVFTNIIVVTVTMIITIITNLSTKIISPSPK